LSLFVLLERLLGKPGTIKRAVSFLGVSRSTLHRWREGHADPRAEGVLALDAFVRTEGCVRIAERVDGQRPPMTKPREVLKHAEPPRRVVPQPEIAAKDVFRAPKQAQFIPAGARGIFEYAAAR
jgi:hypothetical protein